MTEKDTKRLRDIDTSIELIEKFAARENIEQAVYEAITSRIQILGEAAKALSEDLRNEYSEIEWKEMIGMRNVIAHKYDDINEDLVWDVVNRKLPELKKKIKRIIAKIEGDDV